ncbi:sugar ABC transporter substrate-binding protein [Lachnospiraceae bacterium OttesenSCG-928-E19]|nr:sugar ABC transporter substrate-binding protein [Lachnospiraceae bacterium OttesenSCG-928-E19]
MAAGIIVVLAGLIMWWSSGEKKEENKRLKFGATYMTMNNPYFVILDENIKEVVESNGDILITRDPLQDQDKQNEQVADMVEQGIELLFLNPVDWKGVQPSIDLCREKNIPIIVVDTDVYAESETTIVSTITSDNYGAGVLCAQDMMKRVSEAQIVILNHYRVNSTDQRVQGFLDTIASYPQYEVVVQSWVATELEVAMEEMKRLINRGVKYNVVLGGNDPTALGCLAAMQMNHTGEGVLLYGIDGSPDAKQMIRAGYMEGSSAQSPVNIGTTAALTAYEYLAGEEIETSIIIPVELITNENLENYDVNGWQ